MTLTKLKILSQKLSHTSCFFLSMCFSVSIKSSHICQTSMFKIQSHICFSNGEILQLSLWTYLKQGNRISKQNVHDWPTFWIKTWLFYGNLTCTCLQKRNVVSAYVHLYCNSIHNNQESCRMWELFLPSPSETFGWVH